MKIWIREIRVIRGLAELMVALQMLILVAVGLQIRLSGGLAERKMKDEKEALDYFRTSQFVMQERVHIACTLII